MTERLYYADSFLMDFDAIVEDIQELSRESGQSLWRVALDRSAFYPTSGGQPSDIGHLIATARSGAELTAEIVGVEEDDSGQVWHHTAKPLLAGTRVHGVIDAARRLDHIQQHSGQHLLSAAFVQVCAAPTVSFHLGERSSTIDLAADRVTDAELQQVEELANKIVAEDRPVSASLATQRQAEAWLASGDLRKLPDREGELRIVEIADFDRNACGGTHVRSTGQIGGLHLRGIEKVRQGVRVEFGCGLRAMHAARKDFHILTEAGRHLSVGLQEIPEAVMRLQAQAKHAAKQIQTLTSELADYRAAELIRLMPLEKNGLRTVNLNLTPANASGPAYGKLLASKVTSLAEQTVAIFSWRPVEPSESATVIFARSRDLNFDCGVLLRETLTTYEGRGGGSKDMAQGSVPSEHLENFLTALRRSIPGSV